MIAVVGTALVVTSGCVWKSHLANRSDEKKVAIEEQSRLHLSQEETKRLEIITAAMSRSNVARAADQLAEDTRDSFVKSAVNASTFTIQEQVTITGGEAQQLYRAPRSTSQEVQLNGTYFIEGFKWASDQQTARLNLRRKDDDLIFIADLAVSALNEKQKARFKDGVVDRLEVYLSINGTVLHDKITTAKIVSITEQPTKN